MSDLELSRQVRDNCMIDTDQPISEDNGQTKQVSVHLTCSNMIEFLVIIHIDEYDLIAFWYVNECIL